MRRTSLILPILALLLPFRALHAQDQVAPLRQVAQENMPSDLGPVPGQTPTVSEVATLQQGLPLFLPRGAAGFQPNLELTYDSASRGNFVGVGWSLSGLSYIARCESSRARDGVADPIDGDSNDQLCLDGKLLTLAFGDHLRAGATYRTEHETLTRVEMIDSADGALQFRVSYRNGAAAVYGASTSSRRGSPALTLIWLLDEYRDPNGNRYVVKYERTSADGMNVPTEIQYGFPEQGGSPRYRITFSYRDVQSELVQYVGSVPTRQDKLLERVDVLVSGQLRHHYELSYRESPTTRRPLLASLRLCPRNATCSEVAGLGWASEEAGAETSWSIAGDASAGLSPEECILNATAPLDGDARPDFLCVRRAGTVLAKVSARGANWENLGPSNSIANPIDQDCAPFGLVDVTGDGYADLVCVRKQRRPLISLSDLNTPVYGPPPPAPVYVAPFDGRRFQNWEERGSISGRASMLDCQFSAVVDVDADDDADIVCLTTGTNEIDVARNASGRFGALATIAAAGEAADAECTRVILGQINNDGKPDFICIAQRPSPAFCRIPLNRCPEDRSPSRVFVWASSETGYQAARQWSPRNAADALADIASCESVFPIDLNGDGMTEIACAESADNRIWIRRTEGAGYSPWQALATTPATAPAMSTQSARGSPSSCQQYFSADLNSDGLGDILCLNRPSRGSASEVRISVRWSHGASAEPWAWAFPGGLAGAPMSDNCLGAGLGDFDGGGTPSFFCVTNRDGSAALNYLARPNRRDLLVRMDLAGLLRWGITYEPAGISERYSAATAEEETALRTLDPGVVPLREGFWVVSRLTATDLTSGAVDSTTYSWHGAFFDRGHGKIAGFLSSRFEFGGGRPVESRYYNLVFPLTGTMRTMDLRTADGTVIFTRDTVYGAALFDTVATEQGGTNPIRLDSGASMETIRRVGESIDAGSTLLSLSPIDVQPVSAIAQLRSLAPPDWKGRTYFIRAELTTEVRRNLDGSPQDEETRLFEYDNLGNVVRTTTRHTDGSEAVLATAYVNVPQRWRFGIPTRVVETRRNSQGEISRETSYSYDALFRLQCETISPGILLAQAKCYEYDFYGNIVRRVVGSGSATRINLYAYDDHGILLRSETNPLGEVRSLAYQPVTELLAAETGPGGRSTSFEYDPVDRLALRRSDNGVDLERTAYRRCSAEICVEGAAYLIVREISGNVRSIEYFDARARQVGLGTRQSRNDWRLNLIRYDSAGRIESERMIATSRPEQREIRYTYDALARPRSATSTTGQRITYTYRNFTVTMSDQAGLAERRTFDVFGNIVRRAGRNGAEISYYYRADGKLLTVDAGERGRFRFGYDGLGQRTSMTDANGRTYRYVFDSFGQLLSETNPDGGTTTNQYDALGRLIRRSADGIDTIWSYGSADTAGLLTSIRKSDGSFERRVVYANGRLSTATISIRGVSRTFTYELDSYDRPVRLRYPNGMRLTYTYDEAGNQSEIRNGATAHRYVALEQLAPNGEWASWLNGNGLRNREQQGFDEITTTSVNVSRNSDNAEVYGQVYVNDDRLYPREFRDTSAGDVVALEHDGGGRLISADFSAGAGNQMTYDALGRMSQRSGVGTYNYPTELGSRTRLLTTTGQTEFSFAYNRTGAAIRVNNTRIAYDSAGRPRSIAGRRSQYRLDYDENGRLIAIFRDEDGEVVEERRYFDGNYEEYRDSEQDRQLALIRLVASNHIAGFIITRIDDDGEATGGERVRYVATDLRGSVALITDEQGNVLQQRRYGPWGEELSPVRTTSSLGFEDNLGFLSQISFREYGLILLGHRLYLPALGRFIQPDPLFGPASLQPEADPYAYALFSPYMMFDHSGFLSFGRLVSAVFGFVTGGPLGAIAAVQLFDLANREPGVRMLLAVTAAVAVTVATGGGGASLGAAILTGMASGAAGAATYTFLSGGSATDIFNSAIIGGAIGAFTGGVGYGITSASSGIGSPVGSALFRVGGRAAMGGLVAEAQNRPFAEGFRSSAFSASISEVGRAMFMSKTGREPSLRPATMAARAKPDNASGVALIYPNGAGPPAPCFDCNNVGNASGSPGAVFGVEVFTEGDALSSLASQVPGVNSTAYFHDSWMAETTFDWSGYNATLTIVPSLVVTYSALSYEFQNMAQQFAWSCTVATTGQNSAAAC